MKNLVELFDTLNQNVKYVVLRNWDNLPHQHELGVHSDLDLLVEDKNKVVELLGNPPPGKPFHKNRVQYYLPVGGSYINLDLRYPGDGYFPTWFEYRILEQRQLHNKGFYVPYCEDHFWSLLYHVLFHKDVAMPYRGVFKYEVGNRIGVTKPNDPSVVFNNRDLGYNTCQIPGTKGKDLNPNFREYIGTTSKVLIPNDNSFVHKVYYPKYVCCLKSEITALQKLNKYNSPHFPQILGHGKLHVDLSYCGERIQPDQLPSDFEKQSEEIINTLRNFDIVHRDITPLNLHIENGIIKLIDFGWATNFAKKDDLSNLTEREAKYLGLHWKSPDGFDDKFSLMRSLFTLSLARSKNS